MDTVESVVGWLLRDMARMTAELAKLYVPPSNDRKDWELTEQERRVVNQLDRLDKLTNPGGGSDFDLYQDEVFEYRAIRQYLNSQVDGTIPPGKELFAKVSGETDITKDIVKSTNLAEFAKLVGLERDDAAHLQVYLLRTKFDEGNKPAKVLKDNLEIV